MMNLFKRKNPSECQDGCRLIDEQSFPLVLTLPPGPGKDVCTKQDLVGGGTRTAFGVSIYVVGLYICERALPEYRGPPAACEEVSARACEKTICSWPCFDKTLVLIFRRAVPSAMASNGLRKSLRASGCPPELEAKFFHAFEASFSDGVRRGMQLILMCKDCGGVHVAVDDPADVKEVVAGPTAAAAVLTMYVGKTPVSLPAMRNMRDGFALLPRCMDEPSAAASARLAGLSVSVQKDDGEVHDHDEQSRGVALSVAHAVHEVERGIGQITTASVRKVSPRM